ILCLIPFSTSLLGSSGPHIADVNILLPPKMTHPVEYRLQGSDGCFKWSWDHHDVLSVLPEYNTTGICSTSARLKSIAPYGGRKETAVYAADLNTGMVIRCKVYIDIISRIQIVHNSVKLDLDGLAALRVRAFDNEDNVFSSLVGLRFIWKLLPEPSELVHKLVHVPLKDSPLSDCGGLFGDWDIQVKLEESGVFADLFVVKGNEIGHENVSVSLLELSPERLEDNIILTVAEAMSLDPPSPVYVLIGAVIDYTLKVIRGNRPHIVTLPSAIHEWSVSNSSVAVVNTSMGIVQARNLGQTEIVVEDIRVKGHIQISSMYVVLPENLVLFISPLSLSGFQVEGDSHISSKTRWYVVSGRQYLVHAKIYSAGSGGQEIFVTNADDIGLYDNHEHIWSIHSAAFENFTEKKNCRILEAKSNGLGKITATLNYSTGQDTKSGFLKIVQEVMVCNQVVFILEGDETSSRRILLPWGPGAFQEMELQVSGGCGISSSDYKWISSDTTIASVSASGILQAKRPGTATLKVVSIFDPLNYDETDIEISVPASMVMLPDFPVESPVGSHLQASVTLQTSSGAIFHACDAFRSLIKWETESEFFRIVNMTKEAYSRDKQELVKHQSSLHGPSCSATYIYASNSGRTRVHAKLAMERHQYTSWEPVILKASSLIAAHLPVILHQVGDGNSFGGYWLDWKKSDSENQLISLDYLYLAPGTHMDVMLQRGPERWGKDTEFVENVELLGENIPNTREIALIHQIQTEYGIQYRLGCASLGTFKFIFRRGNLVGGDHYFPAISEVQLLLLCRFPSSIVLIADEVLNAPSIIQSAIQAERNLAGVHASPITVVNGRKIRVSAVAISDSGKPFANSSSLNLRWQLNECESLAHWNDACVSDVCSNWERFLLLQNASGTCTVRSTVIGLMDSELPFDATLEFRNSAYSLADAIKLQLVSSLRVSSEFSLLFFSPEAVLNISITGGSCSLETVVNDTHVLKILQPEPAFGCKQLLVAPKGLGTALVTVRDIGPIPPLAVSSTVRVAEIDWIKILTGEYISIEVGNFQNINILAGVADGHSFDDPSQYTYMNIRVHVEERVVEVVETPYLYLPSFTLKASHIGVTTLHLSSIQHSGQEIVSPSVKVEVFAPARIHPSYIFLVPGASFSFTVRGGPKIGSYVKFSGSDDHAAKIDELSGRASAFSPGNITLVATVYGNRDVVLCRAYGKVEVGIPLSAVLYAQSKQIAVGRTMAIYPSFPEGNLFSFYQVCGDYRWNVGNANVLNFTEAQHVYGTGLTVDHTGSSDWQDLNFIQVIHGVSAGKTDVTVSFSCSYKSSRLRSKLVTYSASLLVLVIPNLPLALGSSSTWILPPYYASSDLLPLFSDAYSEADSPPGDVRIAYSLLGKSKRKVVDELVDDQIQVDGAKILTRGSNTLGCVQGTDRVTGRTEVVSCVKVSDVSQIRIPTDEFPLHSLAVGSELRLRVGYRDHLGNPFHEARNLTLFEAETNRPDVVSIESYDGQENILVLAKSQGVGLVRVVLLNDPEKVEFVVILAGPHLYPQNAVIHEGSSLDFVSKRSSLLLSVDSPGKILTNVPFPAKGYPFPVKFTGDRRGSSIPFSVDCEIDPPNVGFAKPRKDQETGNWYCLFFPHAPEYLAGGESEFRVSVKAWLRDDDGNVSGSASALFIGGFSVLEMDALLHLNLTRPSDRRLITIVGNSGIEIDWREKKRLVVERIRDHHPSSSLQLEVKAVGSDGFNDRISFSLAATGQRVEIVVSYSPEQKKREEAAPAEAAFFSWGVLSAAFFVLMAGAGFSIGFLDRASGNVAATAPPPDSVVRRGGGSESLGELSPRTPPQPFMDYIRETIDETPYYRQNWRRRRVNPQGTY
ncbi:hypothetical protein M569_10806, partial [Genlisea aurea]